MLLLAFSIGSAPALEHKWITGSSWMGSWSQTFWQLYQAVVPQVLWGHHCLICHHASLPSAAGFWNPASPNLFPGQLCGDTHSKAPFTWQKRIILLSAFLAGGQEGSLNLSKAPTNTRTRARSSLSPGHLPCPTSPHMSWAGEMCLSQSVG